ncbi:hypothetical protein BS636_13415 [Acinetobacter sp. LoGeW2-3]|uniref:hypothetical protein n=1 Tax=Acinetobacter sp. LoGeW2-3 TaxID=1808001 RepID=UPI000C05B0A3|nr:hypothetical protein [Acinetobacter sp. LoGeW2-3]ATO20597.1 hypothetical protein BS636_13415 [Acinetobacter sp. LoGeW2-3]
MKDLLTSFQLKRNQEADEKLLSNDFKQNSNDYLHRDQYDFFKYRFIDSVNGRKLYYKNFIINNPSLVTQ